MAFFATLKRWGWLRVLLAGTLAMGAAFSLVLAGAAGLAWTSTEKFCISCHEMRDNNFAEYKGTIHDTNRTGVRAICTDCHVPHAPMALLKRKAMASFELYHHFIGHTIDTKEKFEAHRYELALKVWQRMKDTDSLECRNCHVRSSMSKDLQSENAQRRHAYADANHMTCIDCHFAIAHDEPEGPLGPRDLPVNGVPPKKLPPPAPAPAPPESTAAPAPAESAATPAPAAG